MLAPKSMFIASNGAVDAALAGHGVALARKSLVEREIASGRLRLLFKTAIASPLADYLDYPAEATLRETRKASVES